MILRRMGLTVLGLMAIAQLAVAQSSVKFRNSIGATRTKTVRGSPDILKADVGPYSGFIGGKLVDWYCVDYGNGISNGTVFKAYLTPLTLSGFTTNNAWQTQTRYGYTFSNAGAALAAYQQASFLTSFFAVNPVVEWDDIHSAIWSIFDPQTPTIKAGNKGKGTQYWLTFARNWYHTYDYSNVVLITDVRAVGKGLCGKKSGVCGVQEFVSGTPTVVPEPASMTLLASGLAGVLAAGRRRRQRSRSAA